MYSNIFFPLSFLKKYHLQPEQLSFSCKRMLVLTRQALVHNLNFFTCLLKRTHMKQLSVFVINTEVGTAALVIALRFALLQIGVIS